MMQLKRLATILLLAALEQPLFSQSTSQESQLPTVPAPSPPINWSNSATAPVVPFAAGSHNSYCLYGFADYLLLRAQGTDIPYAQPRDGVSPLAVPVGPVATATNDFSSGYRLGGGVAFGDGNFLQGTYTGFHSSTNSMVTAPAGAVETSLLTFPTTPNAALDSDKASLQYRMNFNLLDIDFKHRFWQSEHGYLNWLVGARYAQLQQQMTGDFVITGATTVNSNINFDGGGIRAGIEGEYAMQYGIFVFGRGVVNLLSGRFQANYQQVNVFAGTEASTGASDTRIVPILDLEAGVGWQSPQQRLRLMAGYYFSAWGNLLTTNSLIQGVQNSNFTTNANNFRDTIQFNGLMARIELRF